MNSNPRCCGVDAVWVNNGANLQYFYCRECKKEVGDNKLNLSDIGALTGQDFVDIDNDRIDWTDLNNLDIDWPTLQLRSEAEGSQSLTKNNYVPPGCNYQPVASGSLLPGDLWLCDKCNNTLVKVIQPIHEGEVLAACKLEFITTTPIDHCRMVCLSCRNYSDQNHLGMGRPNFVRPQVSNVVFDNTGHIAKRKGYHSPSVTEQIKEDLVGDNVFTTKGIATPAYFCQEKIEAGDLVAVDPRTGMLRKCQMDMKSRLVYFPVKEI